MKQTTTCMHVLLTQRPGASEPVRYGATLSAASGRFAPAVTLENPPLENALLCK